MDSFADEDAAFNNPSNDISITDISITDISITDTDDDDKTVCELCVTDDGEEEMSQDVATHHHWLGGHTRLTLPFPFPSSSATNDQVVNALKFALPTILARVQRGGYNPDPLNQDVSDFIYETAEASHTGCLALRCRPSWVYDCLRTGLYQLFAIQRVCYHDEIGSHPRNVVIGNPDTWLLLQRANTAFCALQKRYVSKHTLQREGVIPTYHYASFLEDLFHYCKPFQVVMQQQPWRAEDPRWLGLDGHRGYKTWFHTDRFMQSIRGKVQGLYRSKNVDYHQVLNDYQALQLDFKDREAKHRWLKTIANQLNQSMPPELLEMIFAYLEPSLPESC